MPVSVPWPISDLGIRMITDSSGLITTQAFTSGEPSVVAAWLLFHGSVTPSARPEPALAAPTTNERRSILGRAFIVVLLRGSRRSEWRRVLAGTSRIGKYS